MNLKQLSDFDLGVYHYQYLGPTIHQLIESEGYKIADIVKATGVPRSTLYHFFKGNRDFPSSRVFLILKILGISTTEFMARVKGNFEKETHSSLLTAFDMQNFTDVKPLHDQLAQLSPVDLPEILLNLSAVIEVQLDDLELKQAFQSVIVEIAEKRIFIRIGRLNPTEMELFNNIMRFMNWSRVKILQNEIISEIQKQTAVIQTSTDLNMAARYWSIISNTLYNIGTLALQNSDLGVFRQIIDFVTNREIPYYDLYGALLTKLLFVLDLHITGKLGESEKLYNELTSAMHLLVNNQNSIFYDLIIEKDYQSFIDSIIKSPTTESSN